MAKKKAKIQPLPWSHVTNGKLMSAVCDAKGHVVCGSLICQHSNGSDYENHALIVKAVDAYVTQAVDIHKKPKGNK